MANSLGQNIKALRKEQQLSQVALGKMLNISPQAISKWENDRSIPDILTIKALALIFETSLETLIGSDLLETPSSSVDTEHPVKLERFLAPEPSLEQSQKKTTEVLLFKKWLNLVGFGLNLLLYLYTTEFFNFHHSTKQYLIITCLYLGLVASYYLGFYWLSQKYLTYYFWSMLFLNCLFILSLLAYYLLQLKTTTS